MPSVSPELIINLASNTKNIRNICILAHVDHGKTTLSDTLISTNGIISSKMAGKIKYLDHRPDEILRQITMKSSCISLLHRDKDFILSEDSTTEEIRNQTYLIHLIDSPGHVDFSSEVSTAVRVADGAVVLVDVIEGVCIQTHAVIRQAWSEKLKATLVINKVDRLISELQMTPLEAYHRIKQVLEQVNAIMGTLISSDIMKKIEEEEQHQQEKEEKKQDLSENSTVIDWDDLEKGAGGGIDSQYFSPERGNVVFGSAFDGWGFGIGQFAELYSKKLGMKKEVLQKTLWGEFYFNSKTKKIHSKNFNDKMVPMFVQFVLNNIWEVYSAAQNTDKSKLEKMIKLLELKVHARELNQEDPRHVAQTILSKWLPINESVLHMIINSLPNPIQAQQVRIGKIWQPPVGTSDEMKNDLLKLENEMINCDSSKEAQVVIFVSKIFALPPDAFQTIVNAPVIVNPRNSNDSLNQQENKPLIQRNKNRTERINNEKFIAFARIFSGVLKKGDFVHVLGPKYNPAEPTKHHSKVQINEIFLLMGRGVEEVNEIYAGNIFGIGGLDDIIIKTATLSTTPMCSSFNSISIMSSPIVRVAVEPENSSEMPKLVEGLKILNQADPCVEILVQETGEHVIVASGELHLERCLTDLRESFARIAIRVSAPLVAFRETITSEISTNVKTKEKEESIISIPTSNRLSYLKVSTVPLPPNITQFLNQNSALLRRIFVEESVNLQKNEDVNKFREELIIQFEKAGGRWKNELEFIWAFGPRKIGPNILLNHIPNYSKFNHSQNQNQNQTSAKFEWNSIIKKMDPLYQPNLLNRVSVDKVNNDSNSDQNESTEQSKEELTDDEKRKILKDVDNSILNGFQLATSSSPLCEEPMMGVCFIVEDVILKPQLLNNKERDLGGPFSGQIMSATKEACRQAFISRSPRLMEPMYLCNIQIPSDSMGKAYTVLGRRRAKILNGDVKENAIFAIEALLPVAESFGLSEELLERTSGSASTQLTFRGWEILDQDPFFVATTEEELEDIGENLGGIAPNTARIYIDSVRKRKGLPVEEKIVKHAEKQRTLSKKK